MRIAQQEDGQVLPLMAVVIILLLATGIIVFQLALSTNLATVAQTAADAAALAAENEVVRQIETPTVASDGAFGALSIDWGVVDTQALQYANQNGAELTGPVQHIPVGTGWDVIVTVRTLGSLPQGGIAGGQRAYATARASTDPLSQASPPVPVSGEASASASGPRFVHPHGGRYGFFPEPEANYGVGNEPSIAGRLDQLGVALRRHIEGVVGYSPAVSPTDTDPHTCGGAFTARGLEGVSDATLAKFHLQRLPPDDPSRPEQEIALQGANDSSCAQSTGAVQVSIGNPNVHLVPISGGPAGLPMLPFPVLAASAGWAIPWAVVNCESGGQDTPPNSASASGYYQITAGTWAGYGGYPAAYLAPKSIQDAKALQLLQTRGLEPWLSSEPCWGPVIGFLA